MTSRKPAPLSPQVNIKRGIRSCQPLHERLLRGTSWERERRTLTQRFPCVFSKVKGFGASWLDEGRGGSEVTWQIVHVIIVILVSPVMRRAWEPLVSETTTVNVTADRAAEPTPPSLPPHWPGDRRRLGGGRVWGPSSSSAPYTPPPTKNKTATKTIFVKRLVVCGL